MNVSENKFSKQWKRRSVQNKRNINEEYYKGVNPIIDPYLAHEKTHSRAYDAKLLGREIIDNIFEHDTQATHISVLFEIKNNKVKIKIKHNGNSFNPFSSDSTCTLIKKIKYDIGFHSKPILTDSPFYSIDIKFDLRQGGDDESI